MYWIVIFEKEEDVYTPQFLKDDRHYSHICSSGYYETKTNWHSHSVNSSLFIYVNPLLVYRIFMHYSLGQLDGFNITNLIINDNRFVICVNQYVHCSLMIATEGAHKYVGVYRIYNQFEYTKRKKKVWWIQLAIFYCTSFDKGCGYFPLQPHHMSVMASSITQNCSFNNHLKTFSALLALF